MRTPGAPRWLARTLQRVHALASAGRVRFTYKAVRELAALDVPLDTSDACEVLVRLTRRDCTGRRASERTGEWLYVFKPPVAGMLAYVKVILREDCVVVSFHEDEGGSDEEDA